MSTISKRKLQFETSSSSGQQRISRIAQLVRRPSNRQATPERATSLERLSTNTIKGTTGISNNLGIPGSSCGIRKRSASATPLCTPNRPTPMKMIFTSEKKRPPPTDEKNKIHVIASRITDYLQSNMMGALGADFFARGGIKSISTKQFILIVNHFLKLLGGNRLTVNKNYVDELVKVLSSLDYPYTINKSWLKTPNASHSFNNIVIMLGWLHSFATNIDYSAPHEDNSRENHNVQQPLSFITDKEFLDEEDVRYFIESSKRGYDLWNNRNDKELELFKEDLINNFICKKTNLDSIEVFKSDIMKLNLEIDEIKCKRVKITQEDEYEKLSKEYKVKMKEIAKSVEACKEKQRILTQLKVQLNVQNAQVSDYEFRIEELKNIIENQTVNIQDRDNLLEELSSLNIILENNKQYLNDFQDSCLRDQIALSRLLKSIEEIKKKFNNFLKEIETKLNTSLKHLYFDLNIPYLKEEDVEDVYSFLIQKKKENSERIDSNMKKISEIQLEINKLESNLNGELAEKYKIANHNLAVKQQKFDLKETEINHEIEELKVKIAQKESEIIEKSEEIKEQTKEIEKTRDEIEAQNRTNENLMKEIEKFMNEKLQKREENLKKTKEYMCALDISMEKLEKEVCDLKNDLLQRK